MWTDSHCHVANDKSGDDTVDRAFAAEVRRLVAVGTDRSHSLAAIAVARRHSGVWATVGLHPHDASQGIESVADLLDDPPPFVVGVGECGLDYFYEHSPRDRQREAFAAQIQLATEKDLTLVVHTRGAWEETFDILAGEERPSRWVLHCFSGGPEELRRCLELGAYISFSGIVTFKKAEDIRLAAAACPLDRLLVETDSPFLAPVPHRGKQNEPAWAPFVGAAVAEIRSVPVDVVERATWDNAAGAFRLDDAAAFGDAAGAG